MLATMLSCWICSRKEVLLGGIIAKRQQLPLSHPLPVTCAKGLCLPGPPQLRGHHSPWGAVPQLRSGLAAGHLAAAEEQTEVPAFNPTQE